MYPDPIVVAAGDVVAVGRADEEFPGWVWCADPQGREGWMPEAFLDRSGAEARAAVEYDARELTVAVGDELRVEFEHEGWLLCRAADGSRGWVPNAAAVDASLLDLCDRWLRAWTGNDPDGLLAFFTEDARYRDPAKPGGLKGHAELRPYFTKLLAANPDWVWRRLDLTPTDLGFTLKWRATIPVGDAVVEEEGLDIVELKKGLISRNEVYFDRAALLKAMAPA